MERKETKGRRTQLPGKRSQKVENKKKGDVKLAKAKGKGTKADKPPEEKFLSAKELAQMAGVKPAELRKCLRSNFAGRIPRGDDGKQYRIKASDPLVQEIIAKVKEKPVGAELPPQSEADKGEGSSPSPESLHKAWMESLESIPSEEIPNKATAKLKELIGNNQVEIIMSDWKEGSEHIKDVADAINRLGYANAYNFQDGHIFPSKSSGDDLITVIVKEPIPEELAEVIADLYYNFGAELPQESQENQDYSGWDTFSPEPPLNTNSSVALTQSNKPEVVGSNPTPATNEI